MTTPELLIIDDDADIKTIMRLWLEKDGYGVVTAHDGLQGLRLFHETRPALVILDVNMPMMDGWTTAERLREISDVPLVMLTARSHLDDRMRGFRLGVDDYVTKPFVPEELLARIAAILRRVRVTEQQLEATSTTLQRGSLRIDLQARRVTRGEQTIRLSPTEFRLLAALAAQPGAAVPSQTLLKAVWGENGYHEGENLRTYIRYLREKLEQDPQQPKLILTEHGFGYRLA